MTRDVPERLAQIEAATDRLLATVVSLGDGDLSDPSLCESWTRGHVLAHIALNADSLVNLFTWARTGVTTPQYPSWEGREADIDRHSTRTRSEHVDAIRGTAERYISAAHDVPHDRWEFPVAGIGAAPQPVGNYLDARRREVEVHHLDLNAGYGPGDWPDAFVQEELEHAASRFSDRLDQGFEIQEGSSGRVLEVAGGGDIRVSGRGCDLLTWMLGRSEGHDLRVSGADRLPELGPWG